MIDKDESSATLDLNQVRIPDELVFFEALTLKSFLILNPEIGTFSRLTYNE
jgi:hypothetical protein